jgi:uncharacterized protein (DUF58 family)
VTRAASPKLGAYSGLTAFGLIAALAFGRPEIAVLTAPFSLVLVAGLALASEPHVAAETVLDRERVLEGESVTLRLELSSRSGIERLELHAVVPRGLELRWPSPLAVRLPRGEPVVLELPLECVHWGGYVLGELALRARDTTGLIVYERTVEATAPLRVYPLPERLRSQPPPLETQPFIGNQVSRAKGEGIEFADVRPFAPGDRVRRVNWRASARRGELWVNEFHPERNTDVVLFLDSFVDVRSGGRGTLDLAVGAAASLAARYLERKDRVGLVAFGGLLQWLLPDTGLKQRYRIVDALIGTEVTLNYAWKDLEVIPSRTLPPKALVIALSPLLDERAVAALLDLRARGFDLAVIEISPVPFAPPEAGAEEQLAHRLWLLRREEVRARYLRLGVPVAEWRDGEPLSAIVEEVATFRRQARSVRA